MESNVLSDTDQQSLISTFLEIAVGQTPDIARQFLQATNWKLEEALQLFYVGNESGVAASSPGFPPLNNETPEIKERFGGSDKLLEHEHTWEDLVDEVRAPLPVKREVLYDTGMIYGHGAPRMGNPPHEVRSVVPFRNFDEELKRPGIWESDQAAGSVTNNPRDNLASLYRPPFALMLQGPFEKAKDAAKASDKWLLVNLQSTREFSSHMLNRDTWANEAIAQTIISNFIFWQVYDDTEEGSKVCTYYKLDSIPVVLVIDPVTGQKMRSWRGMVQPETLLEDLLPFLDDSPTNHHANLSHKRPRETVQASPQKVQVAADASNEEDEEMLLALAASMEGVKDVGGVTSKDTDVSNAGDEIKTKKLVYPPLPDEPKADRNHLCKVGVRLPNGRRIQRNFLRTDPIKLLWSFCNSQLEDADGRLFRLSQAIPGASKVLEYESNSTFEESGLANSMISVTWE